jgi:hypothetical protein
MSLFLGECLAVPPDYIAAPSGTTKAYRMFKTNETFHDAWLTCKKDGAWVAMPKTARDLEDISIFGRKNLLPAMHFLFQKCESC